MIGVLHRVLLQNMFSLPEAYTGAFVVDGNYVQERLG